MKVRQLMTQNAKCVGPGSRLTEAALLMQELNVGALPVCDGDELVGIITDRDMVVRSVALGRDPTESTVEDAMSLGLVFIYEDDEAEEAAKRMEYHQIRRLPVLNRDNRLVGIISLGDIATDVESQVAGDVLKEVSMPSAPTR